MVKQNAIAAALALSLIGPITIDRASATTAEAPRTETDINKPANSQPVLRGSLTLLGSSASTKSAIPEPPIVAKVDISEQRMNVYVNGLITHSWKVSTAGRGYYTPRGQYEPYRMHTMWHSRKYNNAPMPFAVFFHKGWAIHGTNAISRLGRPASHGCVRLHPKNAKILFNLIKRSGGMKSAKVIISN